MIGFNTQVPSSQRGCDLRGDVLLKLSDLSHHQVLSPDTDDEARKKTLNFIMSDEVKASATECAGEAGKGVTVVMQHMPLYRSISTPATRLTLNTIFWPSL